VTEATLYRRDRRTILVTSTDNSPDRQKRNAGQRCLYIVEQLWSDET
jgi:hypothetical protein